MRLWIPRRTNCFSWPLWLCSLVLLPLPGFRSPAPPEPWLRRDKSHKDPNFRKHFATGGWWKWWKCSSQTVCRSKMIIDLIKYVHLWFMRTMVCDLGLVHLSLGLPSLWNSTLCFIEHVGLQLPLTLHCRGAETAKVPGSAREPYSPTWAFGGIFIAHGEVSLVLGVRKTGMAHVRHVPTLYRFPSSWPLQGNFHTFRCLSTAWTREFAPRQHRQTLMLDV